MYELVLAVILFIPCMFAWFTVCAYLMGLISYCSRHGWINHNVCLECLEKDR